LNKIILPVIVSLLIISLSLTNSAHAVLVQTYNNPTPKDGLQFGEGFGFSVAIDGNNVLVGALREDTAGTDAGAAYLYDTSGNLLQTYINPLPNNSLFGFSVSLDGNNVLVGARGSIFPSTDGSAHLFDTSGNLLQAFNNPTPASDGFGVAVAIQGNNVLVGAFADDTVANGGGAAYLFDTSGNLLQSFFSPTPVIAEQFGRSVSLDGNNVLVGADGAGIGAGAAYLFDTSGNPLQTYNNPTPANNDIFGHSSSIDGNNVLVGARDIAFLFDTSGNLLQTYNNPTSEDGDLFGFPVAIDGNNVLVGAQGDDTGANGAGAVHLFDTSGNLIQTFHNPTPESGDGMGIGLAIDGNNVLAGASSDDTGAEGAGSAYLFNPDDVVVGGEFLPIETTSLILAGAQSFSWMIPVVLSVIGIGLFAVSRKSE